MMRASRSSERPSLATRRTLPGPCSKISESRPSASFGPRGCTTSHRTAYLCVVERDVGRSASILHADLDSFYASVEQRDDPSLRGKPVVVGGGVVLAASYEAKAFGVYTPMNGRKARQLCPGLIDVPPRFEAYTEASKAVFAIFDDTTPLVEGISIDEAFLDVSGLRRLVGAPRDIAMRL